MDLEPLGPDNTAVAEPATDVAWQTADTEVSPRTAPRDSGQRVLEPGYKQTEVGVIPNEWEIKRLGDKNVTTSYSGGTPPTSNPHYYGGAIDWITSGDLNQVQIHSASGRLTQLGLDNSAAKLVKKDTLLIALYGATAGIPAITRIDAAINQAVLAIIPKVDSTEYLFQWLSNRKDWIISTYTQGGQPNLSGEIIRALSVPFPPLPEQRAIATALSDVDALLATLDALIVKKRDLKQAALQQLLTGKQRLPGFSGEWEMKQLSEIGTTYGGITGKSKVDFGTGSSQYIPFLNVITNVVIDPTDLELVRVAASEGQNQAYKGDLFFNGSSETPEEVGMCAVLLDKLQNVYLNSFCFGFRLRSGVEADGLYLAYFFRSGEGRALLYSLAQGATRYNLSKTNFLKLEIPLPILKEQTAIAAVLSDMDAELAALEARRDKTRALKQGMMQELLTGRIRLL